ncbi:MAG: chorismate synthase [Gammaproteobacteria bacterium]
MSGNVFGHLFRLATFGESHGAALGAVVTGCPPGLELSADLIQHDLDRRRPGQSAYTTLRSEPDQVEILSGVFEGQTTGTPIGLLIRNKDMRSQDYSALQDVFRPGHADYTYLMKYGLRDHRGGGRASARETAMRVAAGAIARHWLANNCQTTIRACVSSCGPVRLAEDFRFTADAWDAVGQNPFFFPDPSRLPELEALLDKVRADGDSVGAQILLECRSVPAGLGEPVFDKLDAALAGAMMSINAVKAVEIGEGTEAAFAYGSDFRDQMTAEGFLSNHAGGILGGISTGQPIWMRISFKPTSSIARPGRTVDRAGNEREINVGGRHDPCVALRAVPIVEAMAALVLADCHLRHRGQNMDVSAMSPLGQDSSKSS